MSLTAGTRLGRYEIRSQLGVGGMGDKNRAIEQLNRAYDDRAGWLIYLNVEPVFDPLRSDPRFTELVSRMKFPR